jgi:hypothetical protein
MATSSATALHLGLAGMEDKNTILNPEITFWRSEKPRHTHFVVDYQVIQMVSPSWGTTLTFTLDKNFDLLRRSVLVTQLSALKGGDGTARYTDDIGRAMWNTIKLVSSNTTINTLYPELEHSLEELQKDPVNQWSQLTGKCDTVAELVARARSVQWIWTPIDFYYSKCDGDALPLVNLVGSSLQIKVDMKALNDVVVTADVPNPHGVTAAPINYMYLYNEVIMLNDDERLVFSRANMTYIYQNYDLNTFNIPSSAANGSVQSFDLSFNHPVVDMIVLFRAAAKGAGQSPANSNADRAYFDFTGTETTAPYQGECFQTMQLKLNNNAYWSDTLATPDFFRKYLALTRYGRIPRKQIYPIPFGLYPPSERQTGELNLSKVDSRKLLVKLPAAGTIVATDVLVFTRHFNELQCLSNSIQVSFA